MQSEVNHEGLYRFLQVQTTDAQFSNGSVLCVCVYIYMYIKSVLVLLSCMQCKKAWGFTSKAINS